MQFKTTAVVIFVSAVVGAVLAFSSSEVENPDEVHQHAKFAVVTNGSNADMTSQKFQLNAEDVHLEGNRSHIVHKHAEGVTWARFLQTIPVEVGNSTASRLCVEVSRQETCGDGAVVLNGETSPNLSTGISQGDTLLVIVSTDGWGQISKDFRESELPEAYRPFWLNGREV